VHSCSNEFAQYVKRVVEWLPTNITTLGLQVLREPTSHSTKRALDKLLRPSLTKSGLAKHGIQSSKSDALLLERVTIQKAISLPMVKSGAANMKHKEMLT
jgi:hypothetical protein